MVLSSVTRTPSISSCAPASSRAAAIRQLSAGLSRIRRGSVGNGWLVKSVLRETYASSSASVLPFAAGKTRHHQRAENDCAVNRLNPERRHLRERQQVLYDAEQQHAGERAEHRALAA